METAIVPGIYDSRLPDEQIDIATEDAHQMVLRLAREEGYLVGVSSGANMVAAMKIAQRLKAEGREDAVVVTVFCDSAAKYLSESFWQEVNSEAENWP
jgi:cysteine synthase B